MISLEGFLQIKNKPIYVIADVQRVNILRRDPSPPHVRLFSCSVVYMSKKIPPAYVNSFLQVRTKHITLWRAPPSQCVVVLNKLSKKILQITPVYRGFIFLNGKFIGRLQDTSLKPVFSLTLFFTQKQRRTQLAYIASQQKDLSLHLSTKTNIIA